MHLLVISHTAHFFNGNKIITSNQIVRELSNLVIFNKITHIAPIHQGTAPNDFIPYNNERINYISIKPSGGKYFVDKIDIIKKIPYNLKVIHKNCKNVDWIQFRSPTNLGIYVIPYLSFFKNNKWIKYAGDWKQKKIPISYKLQRWWLKNNFNKSFVTINGKWKKQPSHILTFENPCLTNDEIKIANSKTLNKKYDKLLNLCFVGNLEEKKGLSLLLEALIKKNNFNFINEINIVGDGSEMKVYKKLSKHISNIEINFLGRMKRAQLNNVYLKSHFIILPSFSEGFPKVIAEASCYGCIPIVSKVGSINQYINDENGFILEQISSNGIINILNKIKSEKNKITFKAKKIKELADFFTYEQYSNNLKMKILES